MKYLPIILLLIGCSEPVQRQIPFEYEITETTLTIFKPNGPTILYYSPEVFKTGFGAYDWDEFNEGAFCPNEIGVKVNVVELDERQVVRVWNKEFDFIINLKELRDGLRYY
jgi:hypothetical protein